VLIASLSTVPPRFGLLRPTLVSLLAQSRRPDRVLVTIPKRYRRFPDWDGRPPDLPDGVELTGKGKKWCFSDIADNLLQSQRLIINGNT